MLDLQNQPNYIKVFYSKAGDFIKTDALNFSILLSSLTEEAKSIGRIIKYLEQEQANNNLSIDLYYGNETAWDKNDIKALNHCLHYKDILNLFLKLAFKELGKAELAEKYIRDITRLKKAMEDKDHE